MSETWLREVQKLERLSPDEDLLERARRGPSLPEPPRSRGRVAPTIVALVVFVAGVSLVWQAFGRSDPSRPSPQSQGFATYTDPHGWAIQVPTGWTMQRADYSLTGSGGSGQEFRGDGLVLDIFTGTFITLPANDSILPLDSGTLLQPTDIGWRGTFEFDGLAWTVALRTEDASSVLAQAQSDTVANMISSITFPPWQSGDTRNGWTALSPTSRDPASWREAKISWSICDNAGCYVLAYGNDPPVLLGPIKTCGEGENMTADPSSPYPIVLECPNGPAQSWTVDGQPAPKNMAGDDQQLGKHPVIVAWDGTLLTNPSDGLPSG